MLGLPPGLGGYASPYDRLPSRLGGALLSIPAIKGVEFGLGFAQTRRRGSGVHDVIAGVGDDPDAPGIPDLDDGPVRRWLHRTNAAGGLTGGISNGEPIVVRGAVKPISTLARPLPSADLRTGLPVEVAHYERSDISVVPAAGVIGEAMVMLTLTRFVLEKFGGDSLVEVRDNLARFRERTLAVTSGAGSAEGNAEVEAGSGGDD